MLIEGFQAFDPVKYIQEYYSKVGDENRELLSFFAQAYQDISEKSTMLEFSGGPGLYSLIAAAKKVKEIHFSDFLEKNIQAVKAWKKTPNDFPVWQDFFHEALLLEGETNIDEGKIKLREGILRNKLSSFLRCDAFERDPLGREYRGYYDVVAANFVAESITTSIKVWEEVVGNICSTLKDGGTLIMTSIQEAKYYCINEKYFPAVSVREADLIRVLIKLGFHQDNISIWSIPAEMIDETDERYKGYQGIIFLRAKK
jgi:hypothetical protein